MNAESKFDLVSSKKALKRDYLEWLRDPNEDTFYYVKRTYGELLGEALKTPTPQLCDVINKFTDKLVKGYIQMDEFISLGQSYMLIDYLSNGENLAYFRQSLKQEQTLAWLLCDHATMYTYQENTQFSKKLKALLTQITGKVVDDACKPTLDIVITELYGPATWELYGLSLDENTTEQEQRDVINAVINMDLRIKLSNNTNLIANTDIPPDTVFI